MTSPFLRRVNESLKEAIADEVFRLTDPGLGFLTITGVDTAPDLPLLLANPPALTQILLNLTANAIKFTPPGGQILLRAATTQNGGLEIFVADTGNDRICKFTGAGAFLAKWGTQGSGKSTMIMKVLWPMLGVVSTGVLELTFITPLAR